MYMYTCIRALAHAYLGQDSTFLPLTNPHPSPHPTPTFTNSHAAPRRTHFQIIDGDVTIADTGTDGGFLRTCAKFESYIRERFATA